jgi:predicted ATPase
MRSGICHHVYLPLLSREDSHALVGTLLDDGVPSSTLLDQVWTASSGNPFLITESVRAMQQRDELVLKHGQWRAADRTGPRIPQLVRKLVDTYLGQMDERAGRVLALMALGGPHLTFREIYLAVQEAIDPDMTETGLLDIIDAALHRRVICERGAGYAFAYPLVGAAVGKGLSRQRQAQFHTAIAHAVESCRPGEVELLAYHYARNDDSERGAVYLQRAADRVRTGGQPDAEEDHLWQLLERLNVLGRTEDADQVRQTLRSLIRDTEPDLSVPVEQLQRDAG